MRLGGSSNANEGYVEVNVNYQGWRGVCDDSFDLKDAHVLCRMAGYPDGASAFYTKSNPFGYGSSESDFAVDDLICTGNEASIAECQHEEWYTDNCSKTEWAGVQCNGQPTVQVRLGGSSNTNEGYVEVNYKSQGWKGVCDDSFDLNDAHVLCRMVGYPYGALTFFTKSKPFGYGTSEGDFAVDELKCTGNEASIADCQHKEWYTDNCSKNEWASVRCSNESSVEVRLGGSSNVNEGYVEVKINNQDWKGVCDDSFDLNGAHVICRMVGYPDGATDFFTKSSPFGYGLSGNDFAVDELKCTGTETTIADCQRRAWNDENCSKIEWAGVRCSGEPSVLVRLRGSSTSNEGYVEVNYKSQGWKGVCDDSFDLNDAHVLCRMAGYPDGASAFFTKSEPFGYGSSGNDFAVDELKCAGTESTIADCQRDNWNNEDCSSSEWAGVRCISE